MKTNKENPYDIELHIAEIYDDQVNHKHDVEFLVELVKKYNCVNVLEPFCGTGRILIPLVECSLKLTGIDGSNVMIQKLQEKIELSEISTENNPNIICSNALTTDWGRNYDLIILGGNCFFELATLDEQKSIIHKAYDSLKSGGYLFIDNDNIEETLPENWCALGNEREGFPSGLCSDSTRLVSYVKPVYVDRKEKIWRAERRLEVYQNNLIVNEYKWTQQKHPIGYTEIKAVIDDLGMVLIDKWAGTEGEEFESSKSNRATLWIRKE